MRTTQNIVLVFALLGSALAACGGSQPPPEAAPAAPSTEPAAPAAPPSSAEAPAPSPPAEPAPTATAAASAAGPSFSDMTKDQRKELMKTVVLPTMKSTFQELDAKDFADMTCVTCHGEGAKHGKFDMPNPKLPKLDPANGFEKHMKKTPKVTKFMMERVAPEMAKLLGLPPNDPKTHEGFGCFNCHTMAGK